jgi:hypothetical protein
MIPWYTSLQLLEFGVGVEVLLLVVVWLALAPPCELDAWLISGFGE